MQGIGEPPSDAIRDTHYRGYSIRFAPSLISGAAANSGIIPVMYPIFEIVDRHGEVVEKAGSLESAQRKIDDRLDAKRKLN